MKTSLFPIILLFFCVVWGCSTTPKANLAKFNPSNKALYPPITVVMTGEDLRDPIHRDVFLSALNEANVFKKIVINNPYPWADFAMEVNLVNTSLQDDAESITKTIIALSSCFMVPVSREYVIKGTIKLRFQGLVFEEFNIESQYKKIVSLYTLGSMYSQIHGAYRKAVEKILEEINERNSFERLFEELRQKEEHDGIGIKSKKAFKTFFHNPSLVPTQKAGRYSSTVIDLSYK